jgi:hypothetical protein
MEVKQDLTQISLPAWQRVGNQNAAFHLIGLLLVK